MFRAAHRSSSGALHCICSLWFIYPCGDRPLPRLSGKWIHFPLSLCNGRSPHGYIKQRLQIQFRAPDDERCGARKHFEPSINFGITNSITSYILVVFLLSYSVYIRKETLWAWSSTTIKWPVNDRSKKLDTCSC
jgi:hypothetical protein